MKALRSILFFFALWNLSYAEPVAIKLAALKVVAAASPEGTEKLVETEDAAPGDVIEYQAVYTNSSSSMVRNLVPEIPIPAGLVLLPGSDSPKAASGSLDRSTFAPLPLLDAEGRPVAPALVRALRWPSMDLAAGQTVTLRVRATIPR